MKTTSEWLETFDATPCLAKPSYDSLTLHILMDIWYEQYYPNEDFSYQPGTMYEDLQRRAHGIPSVYS